MSGWRATLRVGIGSFVLDAALDGGAQPLALIGPNGSGKTTVLRAVAGAIPVERAEIAVGEHVLESTDQDLHVPMERRRIGYVPQGYRLFPHLDVKDNVAFGLSTGALRRPVAERRARAIHVLDELGCADLADRRVDGLSGGERQRVALARALALDPQLLLLDEPLAALDATRRRSVRRALADHLASFGKPAVIVTHDVRDVAALGATVVALEGGRVVQRGSLDEVSARPATDFVAEFVGAGA